MGQFVESAHTILRKSCSSSIHPGIIRVHKTHILCSVKALHTQFDVILNMNSMLVCIFKHSLWPKLRVVICEKMAATKDKMYELKCKQAFTLPRKQVSWVA